MLGLTAIFFLLLCLCICCYTSCFLPLTALLYHCAEYKDEDLIPKNTSVIVARIPIKRPNKGRPRFALHLINFFAFFYTIISIVTAISR